MLKKRYFEHETSESLRWFFGSVGFFGLYSYAVSLWGVATGTTEAITTLLSNLFGLLTSAVFIYFTYTLPVYLRPKKVWILKGFISILIGVNMAWTPFDSISGNGVFGFWGLLISLSVGLFFWWYFFQTFDRLSKESE